MTKLMYYSTISLMHLRYELNNCSINGSVQNGVISTTVHYYKVTRSYVSRSWSRVRLSSTMFIVMSNDIYMNVLVVTWPVSAGNGLQIFGRNILYHFLNDVDISTFSINLIILDRSSRAYSNMFRGTASFYNNFQYISVELQYWGHNAFTFSSNPNGRNALPWSNTILVGTETWHWLATARECSQGQPG